MYTVPGRPPKQRLYFALWPDEAVRAALDRHIKEFRPEGGRRVARERWHITVLFLGNITEERRVCVERVAAAVTASRFGLRLDRCGFWPRSGVLWLGAANPPQGLLDLAACLNAAASDCGIVLDQRPFKPHLTLWREVRRCGPLPEMVMTDWAVNEFCLVQSVNDAHGARYVVLQSWPLQAPTAKATDSG